MPVLISVFYSMKTWRISIPRPSPFPPGWDFGPYPAQHWIQRYLPFMYAPGRREIMWELSVMSINHYAIARPMQSWRPCSVYLDQRDSWLMKASWCLFLFSFSCFVFSFPFLYVPRVNQLLYHLCFPHFSRFWSDWVSLCLFLLVPILREDPCHVLVTYMCLFQALIG